MDDVITKHGRKASSLRNKFNQSTRNRIEVKEYCGSDPEIEFLVL